MLTSIVAVQQAIATPAQYDSEYSSLVTTMVTSIVAVLETIAT